MGAKVAHNGLLTGRRVLILDHAIIVNQIPVHGPGLNVFSTLREFGPDRLEYFGQCLNNEERAYHVVYEAQGDHVSFRRRPPRWCPRCLCYVFSVIYAVSCFWSKRRDLCIAVNPLNFLAARLLQAMGRVKKTVMYSADYSDKRFDSPLMNRLYHAVDRYALRHADEVWSVSRAICDLRRQTGLPECRNWHIPNGPVLSHFSPRKNSEEVKRWQLVYVFGAITRASDLMTKHHFDWVFYALENLVGKNSKVKLLMIGRGDFRRHFEGLFSDERLGQYVEFLDIEDRGVLIDRLCESAIGVALYDLSGADHLRYGDSMKIREYFAAGLPALTTPGHSVAVEVAEHGLGSVVRTREAFLEELDRLLHDDAVYFPMRDRVISYSQATDKAILTAEAIAHLMPSG